MKLKALFICFLLLLSNRIEAQVQLGPGVQEFSLNAVAGAAPQTGTVYNIPGQVNIITWIVSFASAPASQTSILEFSNDNSTWATGDTTTLVAGEARTVFTAARFVRATESARSGGGAITITIIGKGGSPGGFGIGLFADGTSSVPSISFVSTPSIGFYRNSASSVGLTGNLTTSSSINAASDIQGRDLIAGAARNIYFSTRSLLTSTTDKLLQTLDNGGATGLENSNGTPTLGACVGGSLTSGSHNFGGEVTGVTGGTCVINFGAPNFTNAPFCTASAEAGVIVATVTAHSSSSITVTIPATNGFMWHCAGRIGT